jgi:hypothetical protein
VFHGDMNRRFRAFDAYTGKQLWEGIVGGHVSVSTWARVRWGMVSTEPLLTEEEPR